MTNRQLGELAIGVLAIYVALLGVLFVPMWVASAVTSRGISFGALIRNLVPIVLYLALASTLWFRRKNLAARAFEVPEEIGVSGRAATIAVRVIGLLMLIRLATGLGALLMPHPGPWRFAAALLPVIITAAIAAYLIFRGDALVAHLTSASIDTEPTDAAAIAFAAVGLFMAATSLPALIASLVRVFEFSYGSPRSWSASRGWLVEHALVLILGVALFLGSAGLARMWRAVRTMPRDDPRDT